MPRFDAELGAACSPFTPYKCRLWGTDCCPEIRETEHYTEQKSELMGFLCDDTLLTESQITACTSPTYD
ncbi:hypothetical protein Q7C36_021533 [Tachysurus vachellii]|uniref:Uncharacterized protein n=1 Tax=Tachysurus vachellii TaxID=175792 RepID=A0AA88LKP3_TACVA|nr:hypothetical protein Q7C36_021533 [Tachysurus vachellii]